MKKLGLEILHSDGIRSGVREFKVKKKKKKWRNKSDDVLIIKFFWDEY